MLSLRQLSNWSLTLTLGTQWIHAGTLYTSAETNQSTDFFSFVWLKPAWCGWRQFMRSSSATMRHVFTSDCWRERETDYIISDLRSTQDWASIRQHNLQSSCSGFAGNVHSFVHLWSLYPIKSHRRALPLTISPDFTFLCLVFQMN